MATTYFDTINGEITGEFTSGVQKDYMRDALGSVTGYVDANGSVVNRCWNKPYGGQLAKTGPGADPAFQWCGSPGYRPLARTGATHDVRARDYDSATGRWTTVDPLWPSLAVYGYARQNPASTPDASGADVAPDFAVNYAVGWAGSVPFDAPITGVDAVVALPQFCLVVCPADYLNFYISLHNWTTTMDPPTEEAGYEGGLSFSPPHYYYDPGNPRRQWWGGGWRGNFRADGGGTPYIKLARQDAGQVIRVRLLILNDRAATGQLTIWGGDPPTQNATTKWLKTSYPGHLNWLGTNAGYAKTLNAADSTSSCKVANTVASWGSPPGGNGLPTILGSPPIFGPVTWAPWGYSTTDKNARRDLGNPDWSVDSPWPPTPLSGALRDWETMPACDPSQFAGLGYKLERFCCCGTSIFSP